MQVLDQLHLKPGMHRSVCGFHSLELGGSCFGWSYEQLGWDFGPGGVMRG
jgi:glycerol 2-dehydrogenase (NADP+)